MKHPLHSGYNRAAEVAAAEVTKDAYTAAYTNAKAEAKAKAEEAFFTELANEAKALAASYHAEAEAEAVAYNLYTAAPVYAKAAYTAAYNEAYYAGRYTDPKKYIAAAKEAAAVYSAKVAEAVESAYLDGFAAYVEGLIVGNDNNE